MNINKLLEELDSEKLLVWHEDDWFEIGYNDAIETAKQLIEYYIVKCKDCIKCGNEELCGACTCCGDKLPDDDFYCANGVRKNG